MADCLDIRQHELTTDFVDKLIGYFSRVSWVCVLKLGDCFNVFIAYLIVGLSEHA